MQQAWISSDRSQRRTPLRSRSLLWQCCALLFLMFLGSSCRPDAFASLAIEGGRRPDEASPVRRSLVAIRSSEDLVCSGVLITPELVITAAHCLSQSSGETLTVRLTAADGAPGETRQVIDRQIFMPHAERLFPLFDLAWLRLDRATTADYQPLPILLDSSLLSSDMPVRVAGFTWEDPACASWDCPRIAQEAESRVEQYFDAPHAFSLLTLFADARLGEGRTCAGDSGGPSFVLLEGRWHLLGINNGKHPLLTPDAYRDGQVTCATGWTVQTFLGDYLPWIEQTAGPLPLHAAQVKSAMPRRPLLWGGPSPTGAPPAATPQTWAEQFADTDFHGSAWLSVHKLLETIFLKLYDTHPEQDWSQLLVDAQVSQALLPEITELGSTVLGLPGQQLAITDLRPLRFLPHLRALTLNDEFYQGLEMLPAMEQLEIAARFGSQGPTSRLGLERLRGSGIRSLSLRGLAAEDLAAINWKAFTDLRRLEIRSGAAGVSCAQLAFLAGLELEQVRIDGKSPAFQSALPRQRPSAACPTSRPQLP